MRITFDRMRLARAAAAMLVALAALIFALKPLSLTMPESDLDGSWMVVLGEAATGAARWGVDLTFTYGPASTLVTRYFTDRYLAFALPMSLGLAVVLGVCVSQCAALASRRRGTAALVLIVAAAEAAGLYAEAQQLLDAFYFTFALWIFLLDLIRPPADRISAGTAIAGAALMGLAALSKTSYGVLALALFVMSDLRSTLLLRRPPVLAPAAILSFLVGFAGFGQRFADLPLYLFRQGEVAAGYGAAMYSSGSRAELLAFLVSAVALLAATLATTSPRADHFRGATATIGVALFLLLAFKAGFVRADEHTQIGWTALGLAGLAVASVVTLERTPLRGAAFAVASLGALWIIAPVLLSRMPQEDGTKPPLGSVYADLGSAAIAEINNWGQFLWDPAAFVATARANKLAAYAQISAAYPLPKLVGTVDIVPSRQTALIANGIDYKPRPSFQDYSTYTAGLIEANRAFYEGLSAPEWILFDIGGLDDRYPSMSEGQLWPLWLSHYEPEQRAGSLLTLHRRALPLPPVLGVPVRHGVRLGQPFAVPSGPVFARIGVHPTFLGRLAAILFRPPALRLDVTLASGEQRSSRLIPALATGGFLLSPMVESADDFALIAFGQAERLGQRDVVEAVVSTSGLSGAFYAPEIDIEFDTVTVKDDSPSASSTSLYRELMQRGSAGVKG